MASDLPDSNLNELRDLVGRWASEKGWNDRKRTFGDDIALMHSELSEALEEFRKGYHPSQTYIEAREGSPIGKPEGIPIEFIDVLIRILHCAATYGIDLDAALKDKLEYNEHRSYRHGGKKL